MRNLVIAGAIVALCSLVCSCADDDSPGSYYGMWGQVDVDVETDTRIYERTGDLGGYSDGYSIEVGGHLVVITLAYAGHDFPSRVKYLGTWEFETEDVMVFRYENYRGQYTVRFEIVQLSNKELTALVSMEGPV